MFNKVCCTLEQCYLIGMLFTSRWKPIEEVVILAKLYEKRLPHGRGRLAGCEAIRIANENESISGSREEDIESLIAPHESDVTSPVSSRQTHDDNLALLSLKVICDPLASLNATIVSLCTYQLSTS